MKILQTIKKFISFILFPEKCLICGKLNAECLCNQCKEDLENDFNPKTINTKLNITCISCFAYKGKIRDIIHKFKFECQDCSGCPFVEKYGHKCKCSTIVEELSLFEYFITNGFANGDYNDLYKDRIANSECINGFHKRKTGILYLLCRDFTANKIEMILRNLLYNLIRLRNLKGTVT